MLSEPTPPTKRGYRFTPETGAGGVELLERREPRGQAGELVLARAHLIGAPFVLNARAGQLRLAG